METGHIALSKVRADGDYACKMGVIDSTGKVMLPFEYDCLDNLVYGFGNTLIAVRNNKEVIIDKNGKELVLGDYDGFEQMRQDYGYFFPKKGDKIGLVSPEGKVISAPKIHQYRSAGNRWRRFGDKTLLFSSNRVKIWFVGFQWHTNSGT